MSTITTEQLAAIEALAHWLAVRTQVPGMLTQATPGASPASLALLVPRTTNTRKPGRTCARTTAHKASESNWPASWYRRASVSRASTSSGSLTCSTTRR